MYLDIGPPRQQVTPRWLFDVFNLIQTAVNHLDEQNFPNGVALKVLTQLEWPHPLVLPAQVFSTTSTTPVDLGGYFAWDPSKFPDVNVYLEASLAVANSAATATCELVGASVIGSVTTTSTALARVRSGRLTMPSTAQNVWVRVYTSNASYAALLAAARLIFVPA